MDPDRARTFVGGSSTGYRGISRPAFRARLLLTEPKAPSSKPAAPPVTLPKPTTCDRCGTIVPTGGQGRFYTYHDGRVRFFGADCHPFPRLRL